MPDHLAQALTALEKLDASRSGDAAETWVTPWQLRETAHRSIALWLGLHVFEPSNQPHVTVCLDP